MTVDKRISKTLSYWLRHKPEDGNLVLDPSGWADFQSLLAALDANGLPGGRAIVEAVVAQSDKNRFEISPDGSLIRARQGHSIKVDLDWPVTEPPPVLYHGTVERFLDAIMAEGLKPMARHHVHLSGDTATAKAVASRRGKPIILKIAALRMFAEGHQFRLSGNGVWLVDIVPPDYLTRT